MEELKPCPFCGGEAVLKKEYSLFTPYANVIILCSECGATINGVVASENYCANDKAIEAWNRRYTDETD